MGYRLPSEQDAVAAGLVVLVDSAKFALTMSPPPYGLEDGMTLITEPPLR